MIAPLVGFILAIAHTWLSAARTNQAEVRIAFISGLIFTIGNGQAVTGEKWYIVAGEVFALAFVFMGLLATAIRVFTNPDR